MNIRGTLNVQLSNCPSRHATPQFDIEEVFNDSILMRMPVAIAYPNPSSSGIFSVRILNKDIGTKRIRAFDIFGMEVKIAVGWLDEVVNVEFMEKVSGIYNIQFDVGEQSVSLRVCILN